MILMMLMLMMLMILVMTMMIAITLIQFFLSQVMTKQSSLEASGPGGASSPGLASTVLNISPIFDFFMELLYFYF